MATKTTKTPTPDGPRALEPPRECAAKCGYVATHGEFCFDHAPREGESAGGFAPALPIKVEVFAKDEREAEAIRRAMQESDVRAFVIIVGTLLPMSTRARERILDFTADYLDDNNEKVPVRAVLKHKVKP